MMRRFLVVWALIALAALLLAVPRLHAQGLPTFRGTVAAPMVLIDPVTGLPINALGSGGTVSTAPATGTGGIAAVAVGTSSTPAIAASSNGTRRTLAFRNEDAAARMAICPAGITPALDTAGCYTLAPKSSVGWTQGYAPQDAFNAIASAANAQLTVEAH